MVSPFIRQAQPQDCRKIQAIAMEAYAPYCKKMDRKPFPMLDDYATHIANGHVYLVETNNEIAGYIVLLEMARGLLLDNIGVAPEFQGCGLGALLVCFAESYAVRAG